MAPGWRFVFAGGGTGKLAIVNRLFAIANEYHYRYPEPQAISRPRFAAMGDFLIEALHLKEKDRLRRFFLRRLQDHHDAADAIQETFLRLVSLRPRTVIANPQAYLVQVAKSVAHRTITQRMAERGLFSADSEAAERVADPLANPESLAADRQMLYRMAALIEDLPPRCQEVFILSRLHGLPNGEIATLLGISRNMVEKHIMRALLSCRALRACGAEA
jgi:RNA polymerase sigma-70 factor (ECF subfamily)